jgi:hypothetical protein
MDVKRASGDGESDDDVAERSIVALRQLAAIASSQADQLEERLEKEPEAELLTVQVPLARDRGSRRQPAPALPDVRFVQRAIRHRQMRKHCFDEALFREPAWDMLLDLTAAAIEGRRISVTSLCIASGVTSHRCFFFALESSGAVNS